MLSVAKRYSVRGSLAEQDMYYDEREGGGESVKPRQSSMPRNSTRRKQSVERGQHGGGKSKTNKKAQNNEYSEGRNKAQNNVRSSDQNSAKNGVHNASQKKTQHNIQSKAQGGTQGKPQSKMQNGTQAKPQSKMQSGTQAKPQSRVKSGVQSKVNNKTLNNSKHNVQVNAQGGVIKDSHGESKLMKAGGHKNKENGQKLEENKKVAQENRRKLLEMEEENRKILAAEVAMRKIRNKVRRKYTLMIFALVFLGLALTYRYSLVIEINDRIRRQNTVLSNVVSSNNQIQKEISMETDLDKVGLLAESKLGMQKPDNHQIIYIRVPRKDHALVEVEVKKQETVKERFNIIEPFRYAAEKIFKK